MVIFSVRHRQAMLLLGLLIAFSGCIPTLANRVPAEAIPRARLVGVSPQVLVYTLDAGNNRSVDENVTSAVEWEAERELGDLLPKFGVRPAGHPALVVCGPSCARLIRWGSIATLEIGLQREGILNYGFHSVADLRFRADLSDVREALDADYVLFVALKQTRQTDGRKVLQALSGGYTIGKQIDAACVADLRDGRMVRCASKKDDFNDLDAPGRLRQVLQILLRLLFAPSPPKQ